MIGVKFNATSKEKELIDKIVDRFANFTLYGCDRMSLTMDLTAVHANGCPMDFQKLLDAPDFDFGHDICGIQNCIDRKTGKLTDFFLPRCSKPEKTRK